VAGSDWPVSTPDPLQAIHVAVNRTAYGETGRAGEEPFLPEQALALEAAFAAYTWGRARALDLDRRSALLRGPACLVQLIPSDGGLNAVDSASS
jgi:predicted amidohydrolase YtcJ